MTPERLAYLRDLWARQTHASFTTSNVWVVQPMEPLPPLALTEGDVTDLTDLTLPPRVEFHYRPTYDQILGVMRRRIYAEGALIWENVELWRPCWERKPR